MRTILFVCVGNSGRSQMAEAFFNRMAEGKAAALSAGTNPAGSVDPTVVEVMLEVGIDISRQKPKRLTTEMIEPADSAITMGCGVEETCPANFMAAEDWGLDDPKGQPLEKVREIRDQIQAKVRKLLEKIS